MGISNEERKRYFFLYTRDWRNSLLKLKDVVEDNKKKVVQNWIDGIDILVGEALAGIVTNRVSIEIPYTKLVTNFSVYADLKPEIVYRSDEWYRKELSSKLGFVALIVGEGALSPHMLALAAFWDSYEKLKTLIHPVYYYSDSLFNFKELQRLAGQILNEKSLLFDDDVTQLENTLIWKYDYFWSLFRTVEGSIMELYQKAITTSIGDIVKHFEKEEEKERVEWAQRNRNQEVRKNRNNISQYCEVPTEESLEQLIEETFHIDELQTAFNDLQYYHGITGYSTRILEKLEYLKYQTAIELKIQKQLARTK